MFSKLKEYAKDHHIAIINDDGLLFLRELIINKKVNKVLEIGTAIGYSALNMASLGCHVTTFERDEELYKIAKNNIEKYDFDSQIEVILHDATKPYEFTNKFDLIFIDGAKAQYKKFFTNFGKALNDNGIIVTDNLAFHNLKPENVSRHTRQLLRKLDDFKNFLKENPFYETTFYDVGDGMSISKRRNL